MAGTLAPKAAELEHKNPPSQGGAHGRRHVLACRLVMRDVIPRVPYDREPRGAARRQEGLVAAAKAELFERIRGDSWREGLSVRALARRYGVHRRLLREALAHAEPGRRERLPA